jgi:biopolymer transport protein ExbD
MNMVMILIPLLLLSIVFTKAGVVDLSSVTSALAEAPPNEEEPESEVPSLVVHVSIDGFRIYDAEGDVRVRGLAPANPDCSDDEHGPAICVIGVGELVSSLNYRQLRDTMAMVREHSEWSEAMDRSATIVRIAADPEVPFDALIATMDAIRSYERDGEVADLFPNVALLTPRPQG